MNARREAVVRLWVRGPGGGEPDVDVIVDSGFTASLTLPLKTVQALGPARQSGGKGPARGRASYQRPRVRRWWWEAGYGSGAAGDGGASGQPRPPPADAADRASDQPQRIAQC